MRAEKQLYKGIGIVTALEPENRRLVVDHEKIEGLMAAHEMSYEVAPATLLEGLKPGDKIRFVINADKRIIVDVKPFGKAGLREK